MARRKEHDRPDSWSRPGGDAGESGRRDATRRGSTRREPIQTVAYDQVSYPRASAPLRFGGFPSARAPLSLLDAQAPRLWGSGRPVGRRVSCGSDSARHGAGRLAQVVESPSGDVTTYQYDAAGRVLQENRTGQRQYTSVYTYDSRGNRLTAVRSENGVVSHNGVYTYDDASRLVRCVDSATQQTEVYTWNPDGTLASYPGPGYTRLCEYDEEQRLIRIKRDYGDGNVQTAYEYGYGFDGGRRWRKDYVNSVWTRYPCGAASCAGDLIEQTSDLNGGNWTTSALNLKGLAIVRRNGEYHHFDVTGTAGIITDSSHTVLSSNVYDSFGVERFAAGAADTPWRYARAGDEGLVDKAPGNPLPSREVPSVRPAPMPLALWPFCGDNEWLRCIVICWNDKRGPAVPIGCIRIPFKKDPLCTCWHYNPNGKVNPFDSPRPPKAE